MSTNISEGLPAKKKAAPVVSAPKGGDKPDAKKGATAENSGKRIRQAVYDIRYRARREDIDLKQAFSQYMSNTSMDQKDRAEVRSKLFGKGGVSEQYIGASDDWAVESMSKVLTRVFEHHQKDKDGNTIPHEDELVTEYERKLSEEKARKYKVRVTDPKSEKSYVRYADREKITALRGKGLKVEMTEYGTPYEGEKKRGEETAKALGGGGKKAKKDYDGDGKVESGSKEHAGAVHNAIQRAKGGKADGKDTRKEEVEQLDELSDDTLIRYGMEAQKDKLHQGVKKYDNKKNKYKQRSRGLDRAMNKLSDRRDKKDKDKNQNEEFLADGTTSTEPSGKKINPKKVDNYKSGAVQIAPVDEADPQNGYGVKEGVEVKKKDNRANYAYVNFMKNKMRAAFGVKNVMPMVDPDEAEEKFEKLATSMKGTSGDEEEKEGACESVDRQLSSLSKTIMERGITHSMGVQGMRRLRGDKPSTNIPTESNPDGGVRDKNDPTSYPSGGEIKNDNTPSPDIKPDTLTKPLPDYRTSNPPKRKPVPLPIKPAIRKPVPMRQYNSYDPLSNKKILGISEKILKKNFDLGEEGYDIARDEGKVKPSEDKKDATTMPVSDEVKKTQKKNKGASAYEIVKKKYGKTVMNVDKKKKEEK